MDKTQLSKNDYQIYSKKALPLKEIEETVKRYKELDLQIQIIMQEDSQKKRILELKDEPTPKPEHNFSIHFQVGFYTIMDDLKILLFDAVEGFADLKDQNEQIKLIEDFNVLCNYAITPSAAGMIKAIEAMRAKSKQEMDEDNAHVWKRQHELQKKPQ